MIAIRSEGTEFCMFARELLEGGIMLRYRVEGGSMFPFIRGGDILSVSPTDLGQVRIGDVLVGESVHGTLLAHRLVGKGREADRAVLITRGDALPYEDPPLGVETLLGCVIRVERQGRTIALTGHLARLQGRLLASSPLVVRRLLSFLERMIHKLSLIRKPRVIVLGGATSSAAWSNRL